MEVYEIGKYLPLEAGEKVDYIKHHLDHFSKCIENNLCSSAFPHMHILYMIFVYFQVYRISKIYPREFHYGLIGFPREQKSLLEDNKDPFLFWKINEKTVFRFFRIVGIDDGAISSVSFPVINRNNALHAKGEIYCQNEIELEKVFENYIKLMDVIVKKQKDCLLRIYDDILQEYEDPDMEVTRDNLTLNLLIPNLFSEKELELIVKNRKDRVALFIKNEFDLY